MYRFMDLINVLYLTKQLHDLGKFEIFESWCDWELTDGEDIDYDLYQHAAYTAIQDIFKRFHSKYEDDYGYDCCDIMSFYDKVIVDYYRLAGKYQRNFCKRTKRKDNPYVVDAKNEASKNFGFSYCLDWRVCGVASTRYASQSRLEIFIDYNGECDIIGVAVGLVDMYKFFTEESEKLKKLLSEKKNKREHIGKMRRSVKRRKKSRSSKWAAYAARTSVVNTIPAGQMLTEQREAIAA